jgi:hypothetical protein
MQILLGQAATAPDLLGLVHEVFFGSIAMDVDERCVVWRGAWWVGRTGVI